ncbi:hypothetical protein [Longilinea arvoryzae]|nr:hypothetical protein [Longilinea arvoryzae]
MFTTALRRIRPVGLVLLFALTGCVPATKTPIDGWNTATSEPALIGSPG